MVIEKDFLFNDDNDSIGKGGGSISLILKASHQWAETFNIEMGSYDFRAFAFNILADEIRKANVGLNIKVYPAKSLYKPKEQYEPMKTGKLDISSFPLAYASTFHPEFDITLMPGIIKNHEHATRMNDSKMMKEIKNILKRDKIMILSNAWLSGGFVSNKECFSNPSSVKNSSIVG